jgi:acyl carrier protein
MALTDRVAELFAKNFGLSDGQFSLDAAPEDVPQWDSLGHMRLVTVLEETFGVQFEVDEITEMSSCRKIVEILRAKGVQD